MTEARGKGKNMDVMNVRRERELASYQQPVPLDRHCWNNLLNVEYLLFSFWYTYSEQLFIVVNMSALHNKSKSIYQTSCITTGMSSKSLYSL
jgi:hypothetical protein